MTASDVNDTTFHDEVLLSERTVVVDFWAPWCQPCKKISPVIDELGEIYPQLKVVKVNIDDNPQVAGQFGITGVPTVAVFDGGEQMLAITGAMPKRVYLQKLEPWLQ